MQFRSSEQASRATRLDGKDVGEKLKLVVKISDPEHKQNRSGAMYEGREIYVSNLDWSATEAEVIEIFSKYGGVERVRIPKNIAGKSKGIAFVIFSSKVSAPFRESSTDDANIFPGGGRCSFGYEFD